MQKYMAFQVYIWQKFNSNLGKQWMHWWNTSILVRKVVVVENWRSYFVRQGKALLAWWLLFSCMAVRIPFGLLVFFVHTIHGITSVIYHEIIIEFQRNPDFRNFIVLVHYLRNIIWSGKKGLVSFSIICFGSLIALC